METPKYLGYDTSGLIVWDDDRPISWAWVERDRATVTSQPLAAAGPEPEPEPWPLPHPNPVPPEGPPYRHAA